MVYIIIIGSCYFCLFFVILLRVCICECVFLFELYCVLFMNPPCCVYAWSERILFCYIFVVVSTFCTRLGIQHDTIYDVNEGK